MTENKMVNLIKLIKGYCLEECGCGQGNCQSCKLDQIVRITEHSIKKLRKQKQKDYESKFPIGGF